MIHTRQLRFGYKGSRPLTFPDIHCGKGEHALILGPSGTGKTTLLHLLGGLLTPDSGEIKIGQTDLHSLKGPSLDHFRGRHIGIIFQRSHFIRSLSAIENLMIASSLSGQAADKLTAGKLLDQLGIGHNANKYVQQMSVGEQQRLSIARAVIHKPSLLLADEPSSALDDDNCRIMITLLQEMASSSGSNLIIVTHDNRIRDLFSNKIFLQPIHEPA